MARYRSKMRMDARTYLMIRDSKFYRDDFSLVAKIKEVANMVNGFVSRNKGKIIALLMASAAAVVAVMKARSKNELQAIEKQAIGAVKSAESLVSEDIHDVSTAYQFAKSSAISGPNGVLMGRKADPNAYKVMAKLGMKETVPEKISLYQKLYERVQVLISRIELELMLFFKKAHKYMANRLMSETSLASDTDLLAGGFV